jgi:hypothetical protein
VSPATSPPPPLPPPPPPHPLSPSGASRPTSSTTRCSTPPTTRALPRLTAPRSTPCTRMFA